jgi:hypothetical protein
MPLMDPAQEQRQRMIDMMAGLVSARTAPAEQVPGYMRSSMGTPGTAYQDAGGMQAPAGATGAGVPQVPLSTISPQQTQDQWYHQNTMPGGPGTAQPPQAFTFSIDGQEFHGTGPTRQDAFRSLLMQLLERM